MHPFHNTNGKDRFSAGTDKSLFDYLRETVTLTVWENSVLFTVDSRGEKCEHVYIVHDEY